MTEPGSLLEIRFMVAPVSTVAIPFIDEDPGLVLANVLTAARHPRVDRVWAVGRSDDVSRQAGAIAGSTGAAVEVINDQRIGTYRPGKGDAMNTALQRAAAEGVDRLHFYDADITNFDSGWIDGAERAADSGFDAVRHSFARAATDAMITWLVTRPMLAMKFPGSALPQIGQPLGGELLLNGSAIRKVAAFPGVAERSDWGIDTVLTHAMVASGLPLYEHHVASGKSHTLYGSLQELKTMLVECFDAVTGLPDDTVPATRHARDAETPAPETLRAQAGYSVERTRPLLSVSPTRGEMDAIDALPGSIPGSVIRMIANGDVGFLDEETWWEFLAVANGMFRLGDAAWESLLFRMWTGRVLHYTDNYVPLGYEKAISYLAGTIANYQATSSMRSGPTRPVSG
jgi:mannosylglycerate synthase